MDRKLYGLFLIMLFFSLNGFSNSLQAAKGAGYSDSLRVRVYSKGKVLKASRNPCSNGRLKISVRSSVELHFYVFDLSGTLIHRATLNDKEKSMLPVLEKGTYLYDVFENDLSIEEGTIIIR